MPNYDLVAVWEEHLRSEFVARDVNAPTDTMVPDACVNHVPTLTGGVGRDEELYSARGGPLGSVVGPSVFVGIEGEQMIGAATVRGAIHLLHSSHTPIASLLETTEQALRVAVS